MDKSTDSWDRQTANESLAQNMFWNKNDKKAQKKLVNFPSLHYPILNWVTSPILYTGRDKFQF